MPFLARASILFVFAMGCTQIDSKANKDIEFIADFMSKLNYSNKIFTHLCWRKKDDLVALSKALSNTFSSHSLLDVFDSNNFGLLSGNNIFVINISCEGSLNYISQGLRTNAFDSTSTWIIFADLKQIKQYNFYFPLNSLVYVVESENNSHFFVKNICKFNKRYSDYVEVDIGEWISDKGFLYFNKFSLRTNRSDLMGSPIRISYVLYENDTLNHLFDYREIHTDKVTKANYIITSYLLEFINATEIDVWADNWGYRNEVTKLYNGMYGDLMLDRADIAGTPGFIQTSRIDLFRFIPPTSPANVLLIFQAPPLSFTSNLFVLPFTTEAWIAFTLLMVFSTVVIYFVFIIECKSIDIDTGNKNRIKPSILDTILLQWTALTQRGNELEPKTCSGKLVLYFTCTLCLFMYTGFSASIVVLMQSTSESITDMGRLYDTKMEIGVEDVMYNRYYFTTPNEQSNETYRKLFFENRIAPKNNWFTPKDGVERVRRGFFAFHVEVGAAYGFISDTFTEKEKCKLRTCRSIYKSGVTFTAVPRNSVYTELFLVGRIFEIGLQKREHQKYFATKPQCIGTQGNYDSVRFLDCYFPFLILGFGFVVSCIIFISEIFVSRIY